MEIILASASPRRKEILEAAGYSFKIVPADIDETPDTSLSPKDNVLALGLKKALHNASLYKDAINIGCDTIVVLDDVIYGKPKDEEDAFRMLSLFSGKTHFVYSGVGIVYQDQVINFVVESKVTFKKLSEVEIKAYIASKECFGKAGSYAIQGLGRNLILKYEGEYENIVGLPIREVKQELTKLMEVK